MFSVFLLLPFMNPAQVIDKIIATVGSNIVLQSDIEFQYAQFLSMGNTPDESIRCEILDQLLLNKLLINQAQVDSVEVGDSQVESELDRRIRYFVAQVGSEKKLEEYYKKSINEIKAEFRDDVKKQLLAQTMQSKITKDITASPSDVKNYYTSIPPDSLPYINSEMEVARIVRKTPVSTRAKDSARAELERIRERVAGGADFAAMAALYSEDPGSAKKGGELGFVNRGDLVPEFEAAAFRLKDKEVSPIIETKFGFHIIQLIERRGDQINVRHVLVKPEISPADLDSAKVFLDSIAILIRNGKMTFSEAAVKYSDEAETKNNGGVMSNPQTGTTKFEASQLDPNIFFQVDKIKTGELTGAVLIPGYEGQSVYQLLTLRSKTDPHRANLRDDYQRIQNAALSEKQGKAISAWVKHKKENTYINIADEYKSCALMKSWIN